MDGGTPRKYGIGDRAPRREDHRLLTGGGRYLDDVTVEGQSYAYFVRSPHAMPRSTTSIRLKPTHRPA